MPVAINDFLDAGGSRPSPIWKSALRSVIISSDLDLQEANFESLLEFVR